MLQGQSVLMMGWSSVSILGLSEIANLIANLIELRFDSKFDRIKIKIPSQCGST